jgi:heat shock protein HtpX
MVAWGVAGAAAILFSYAFALALAIACLALPVAAFEIIAKTGSFVFAALLLGIFGAVVGVTVLWSLVPTREKFQPPGVPVDLAQQPRLSAEIQSVAAGLGETMPSEVYLIPDANAFVAQRGGIFSGGHRRILALGLPLMEVLSVSEFRGLLAHEFAHFYSGDTRLGPWVYKARTAMARVYNNLGTRSGVLSILTRWAVVAIPYMLLMGGLRLCWTLFLRLTQLISRRQEFRSDEIACHLAGSDAFAEALRKLPTTSAALRPYWQQVVLPVAARGYQPDLADGFGRFMTAPQVIKAGTDALERDLRNTSSQPYDTHPPLGARLARVTALATERPSQDNRRAVCLLDDLNALEAQLLRLLIPALKATQLKPLVWETAGPEVYVPMWRREISPYLSFLSKKNLLGLPDLAKSPKELSDKIFNPPGILLNKAQRDENAIAVLSMALALALFDNGWVLHTQPGSFRLQFGDFTLVAHNILSRLRSGDLSVAEWESYCKSAGMNNLNLSRHRLKPCREMAHGRRLPNNTVSRQLFFPLD